jgi:hypothetical protein
LVGSVTRGRRNLVLAGIAVQFVLNGLAAAGLIPEVRGK